MLKVKSNNIFLLIWVLVYKFAIDIGFANIITSNSWLYTREFSSVKWVNGLFWIIILFFTINHSKKQASTFLLMFMYMTQIIPITAVYAGANLSFLYYNALCFTVALCNLYVGLSKQLPRKHQNTIKLRIMILVAALLLSLFLIYRLYRLNGIPSLYALLNIDMISEYRNTGGLTLVIGHYDYYVMTSVAGVVIPFLFSYFIFKEKYAYVLALMGIEFLVFLYSGFKAYLFVTIFMLVFGILLKKEVRYGSVYRLYAIAYIVLISLTLLIPIIYPSTDLFEDIYKTVVDRVEIIPAMNKFYYYDFFSHHQGIGLSGILPKWIINAGTPYDREGLAYMIGRLYYNSPTNGANTGFLVEGYARLGFIGMFLEMFLFGFILKLIDRLQYRTNYGFAVCASVYQVFTLADAFLVSNLFFGTWGVWLLLIIFFRDNSLQDEPDGGNCSKKIGKERILYGSLSAD